jgi:hypothetical protein
VPGEQLADSGATERLETEPSSTPVLAGEAGERLELRRGLVPGGEDDEQRQVGGLPEEVGQHDGRSAVEPVGVLDGEADRPVELLDDLGDRPGRAQQVARGLRKAVPEEAVQGSEPLPGGRRVLVAPQECPAPEPVDRRGEQSALADTGGTLDADHLSPAGSGSVHSASEVPDLRVATDDDVTHGLALSEGGQEGV